MPCNISLDIKTECESVSVEVLDPVCIVQGGDGGTDTFIRTAGDNISALRVVWENAYGVVKPLDYRDYANVNMLAGLTITAANSGSIVYLQRGGVVDAAGLGLAPGRVWVGESGQLTQTQPNDGASILVGLAVAPARLYLSFNEVVFLRN